MARKKFRLDTERTKHTRTTTTTTTKNNNNNKRRELKISSRFSCESVRELIKNYNYLDIDRG